MTGRTTGCVFQVLTRDDQVNATAADQTESQTSRDRYASAPGPGRRLCHAGQDCRDEGDADADQRLVPVQSEVLLADSVSSRYFLSAAWQTAEPAVRAV